MELVALRSEAGFDVPQALAIGQLRKRQTEKLLETRKALGFVPARVSRAAATKSCQRKRARQLGKKRFGGVHGECPRRRSAQSRIGAARSRNRDQEKQFNLFYQYLTRGLPDKDRTLTGKFFKFGVKNRFFIFCTSVTVAPKIETRVAG